MMVDPNRYWSHFVQQRVNPMMASVSCCVFSMRSLWMPMPC